MSKLVFFTILTLKNAFPGAVYVACIVEVWFVGMVQRAIKIGSTGVAHAAYASSLHRSRQRYNIEREVFFMDHQTVHIIHTSR